MNILRALLAAAVFVGALAAPSTASANPRCDPEGTPHKFIWFARQLDAGTQYTIETANITGDTVMHLFSTISTQEITSNDDAPGTLASRIIYTPTFTGTYHVLVRSYGEGSGVADLRVNGTTVLTQNTYGGTVISGATWNANERIRATGARRGVEDPMLFLAAFNTDIVQFDDDSGPNTNSMLVASVASQSSSLIIYGSYPGSPAGGYRLTIEPVAGAPDSDGDLVPNSVETACGLNPNLADSDHDTIPDSLELWGNNGFSFSGGSQFGDAPTRRNLYVEIDTMNNAAKVPPPFAGLSGDVQSVFNAQPNAIDTYVEQESSPSLPYKPLVALTSCVGLANCVTIPTLQTTYFSAGMPERKPYFHYVVYGDDMVDEKNKVGGCRSGVGGELSNTFVVTMGSTCAWVGVSADMQRGTTIHELGHNLNLVHNSNDDATRNYSQIHVSIMNYRYQFPGVPGIAGILKHTYSYGNNNPANCFGSPKQRCIIAEYEAYGAWGDASLCAFIDPYCDTDVQEWNNWLTTDFVGGTVNQNPGAGPGAAGTASIATAPLQPLTAAEFTPFREAIGRNLAGGKSGPLKAVGPDPWAGPVVDVALPHKQALAQAVVADLKNRGLAQDRDFHLSDDGTTVTQSCQ